MELTGTKKTSAVFSYLEGESELKLFQDLFKQPDFVIDEERDPDSVKLQKLSARLSWLQAIESGMQQDWWRGIEETLLTRMREIDSVHMWQAYYAGEDAKMRALAAERTGIVTLFQELHKVSELIAAIIQEREIITAGMSQPD